MFTEIESPLFAATLGVVSTPRAFDSALLRQPVVLDLIRRLTAGEDPGPVLERIDRLLREPSDARFCHPRDLAVGIYLRVLEVCAPDTALAPAKLALALPNLWWGKVMATRVEYPRPSTLSIPVSYTVQGQGIVRHSQTNKASRLQPTAWLKSLSDLVGKTRMRSNSSSSLSQLNPTQLRTNYTNAATVAL